MKNLQNEILANHLSLKESVETARSMSVEICAKVAVAYNSLLYNHVSEAIIAKDFGVILVEDCIFGEPWRWNDFVWENGKKI